MKLTNKDFLSVGSIIYFITLSSILFISIYNGKKIIQQITTNNVVYILYLLTVFTIYFIFLGMYYLDWTLNGIFVIFLMFSVLIGLISFLLIYFGSEMCTEVEEKSKVDFINYIIILLLIIIIYLGFYGRNEKWNIYSTIRFIILLIIARLIYYLIKIYNLKYRLIVDIILLIILFIIGKRFFI